jgi:pilus assembly protein FimV
LPLDRAPEAKKLIAKSHRWQKTALAVAAIALIGLPGSGAYALSLGRLTVQSALGEPLRAEIEVPEITADEAASLKVGVALPDAFVAAGMEYNPAMSSLQATLMRRADGRAYLRLSGERTINDPFVDLILEASWSQGRIVRDYTLLFDPPSLRSAPAAPTLAQTPTAPVVTNLPPKAATTPPPATVAPRTTSTPKASAQRPATAAATAPAAAPASVNGDQLTVKKGDTASKIANSIKPAGVSLDQMLVAMLRSNPEAFVNDNLNRIRAGAVINVPNTELAQSVPQGEASKLVVAQSKDFNDFRRNLAASAPAASVAAADRKAGGSVQTKVDDKKPASATPDKLTLSKGSIQSKEDETKIAKEREAKDAAARAAEISKNIKELSKIGSAAAPAGPSSAPASAAKKDTAVPVAVLPVPAAPAPVPVAEVAAPAQPKAVVPVPLPEPEEPALLDELLADPMVPAGAAGLIALLGGYAAYRIRQRKKNAAQNDSAFLESRLQPDSFFGTSGGQRVDTNATGSSSASSMVYSASQLDAADDVDPVAEADVYLAYGRDLQAEEILKEAVRTNPGRLAIHTKLLEIFSKRRDARSFESSAMQAYKLTGASSPDWSRICEMGLAIDPNNALYQPGGAPESAAGSSNFSENSSFNSTVPQSAHAELGAKDSANAELDLDLDFSLDDSPSPSAISDVTGGTMEAAGQTVKMAAEPQSSMEIDFDVSDPAPLTASESSRDPVPAMPEISLSLEDLEAPVQAHELPSLKFESTGPAPVAPAVNPTQMTDSGLMEFDLGSLSLDLESSVGESTQSPDSLTGDPLETKLALAEEFISIGDEDGARALIEEVVSEASGDMRAKAQRALAQLS